MNAAIAVSDAFRIYESGGGATVALEGLDLSLEAGEVVVVLGPSGSGKTTLLRVVAGLEQLSAGSARVLGTELGRLDPAGAAGFRARHLGLLEQHYARALSSDLTCRQTVALQMQLLGSGPDEARAVAGELLAHVGLADRADERPRQLSGGEQQRVAVCAAVAHRPRLLLADEPAGELDAVNAAVVYRLLGELADEAGATALIVSHDREAASIADRVVHIRDGRVVEEARSGAAPQLVVSKRGWLQLPPALLQELGSPGLVDAERRNSQIVLSTAGSSPATDEADQAPSRSVASGRPAVAELRAVTKSYPMPGGERVVFSDVSLVFRPGVFTALVGRSGSGKTTLLHILAGLERAGAGDVVVAGQSLAGRSRSQLAAVRRRDVALVTQEPGLVPHLSALENVELGLSLRGTARDAGRARAALVELGLGEGLHQRASLLSAGERERVAIARALAADSRLLLVDEPTARLDEENGRSVGRLLARAAHERRLAVVCATHDPALIELADEVVELDPVAQRSSS